VEKDFGAGTGAGEEEKPGILKFRITYDYFLKKIA
jgi:hypothetical protein